MAIENQINIKVTAKDNASQPLKDISNQVSGLDKALGGMSAAGSVLTGVVSGLTTAFATFAIDKVIEGVGKVTDFFGDSVSAASNLQRQFVEASLVSKKFNVDFEQLKSTSQSLGKELRIGTSAALQGLSDLLKSGLSLDKSTDLLRRFTNEALTGKRDTISLSDAVTNLTYAYKNENSALGNLSGISENFKDIIDDGRSSLISQGYAVKDITDDMAKYEGMIKLTDLTLGSSEMLKGTLVDKQAEFNNKIAEFQYKLGNLLLPIVSEVTQGFMDLFDAAEPHLTNLANWLIPEIGRIFREDINPQIVKFTQYLASEDFKKDLLKFKEIALDVKEALKSAYEFTKKLIDAFTTFANSPVGQFMAGVGQQMMKNPLEMAVPFIPVLRQMGILPKYAEGTSFHPGGLAMVGEKGAEIVNLPRGSQVLNNEKTRQMMSNTTFNFYGYDSEQISNKIQAQLKFGY